MRLLDQLRDQRGSMLIDSMIGIAVAALVITSFSSLAVATSTSVAAATTTTRLHIAAQSAASDAALNPAAVPTGGETRNINGQPVTVWSSSATASTTRINASIPRDNGANCQPPRPDRADCITAGVTVPLDTPAPASTPLTGTWSTSPAATTPGALIPAGDIGTAEPPAGASAIRYVVRVNSTTAGTLTFTDSTGPVLTVPVEAGADQYFYGTLTTATPLTLSIDTAMTLSHLYLYEAAA